MQTILEKMSIEFDREYSIGSFHVDFFLPKYSIVIECDGEMWHKNQFKESKRDDAILRSGKVKKILHFKGHHILKRAAHVMKGILDTIKEVS